MITKNFFDDDFNQNSNSEQLENNKMYSNDSCPENLRNSRQDLQTCQRSERSLKNNIEELKSQTQNLENDAKKCQENLRNLEKDKKNLEEKNNNLHNENQLIKSKIEELKVKLKNCDEDKQTELLKIIEKLKESNDNLQNEKKLLEVDIAKLQDKIKEIKDEQFELENQLQELKNKNGNLENETNVLAETIEELKQKLKNYDKNQQTELLEKIEQLEQKNKDLENKKNVLKSNIEELKETIKVTTEKQSELENQIKVFEQKKSIIENEKELLEINNEQLAQKIKDAENKHKNLVTQIVILEEKLKKCQEKLDNQDDLELGIICNQDEEKLANKNDYKEIREWIIKYIEKSVPKSAKFSRFQEANLSKAITNNEFIINNLNEISTVEPSTILLCRQKMDGLILKVMQEILMTNFWNGNSSEYGLYNAWAMNTLDYSDKGNWGVNYRLAPKKNITRHEGDSVFWTRMLYNSVNSLYIDQIYKEIENYLNKMAIDCSIIKSYNSSSGKIWNSQKVFVSHGSLPFYNIKPIAKEQNSLNNLYYYLQISFDIQVHSINKVFPIRGFTILLSSGLDLYKQLS